MKREQPNYRKLATEAAIEDLEALERTADLPALRAVVADGARSPIIRAIASHKVTRLSRAVAQ